MTNPTRPPRIVALVGMPGAGKTVCAAYLEEQGYFQFRFGSIIVEEVKRRGLAVAPQNERQVREELRARDGMAAIARLALPTLREALTEHECIIIDGLYSFSEYKLLRDELGDDIVVIAITAARAQRYERLAKRPIRPLTPEEAEERDFREIERIEKGGPIAIADYTLVNDLSVDELLAKLDALLLALGIAQPTAPDASA